MVAHALNLISIWRVRALTLTLMALLVWGLLPAAAPVGAASDADVAPGRVIVKLRGRSAASLRAAAATYGATKVEDRPQLESQLWRVPAGSERDVARRAATRPDVEYAEPDRIVKLKLIPNDALFDSYQWNLPKVNAPAAWDVTTGDPSVVVAVIDSGFDPLHPDRPASLRLGCDYVVWGGRGYAGSCPAVSGDENGHGTHVGGIVAARQNNALGVSGVAPNVTLLAIRTADADGSSYVSDVSAAIREAADGGARVINLSLGGTSSSQSQQSAVNYAIGRGAVVVAAAGNEYQEGNPTSYPAAYPGVLAVASASDTDQHSPFSNTGPHIAISAPGGSANGSSDGDVRHWITSLYPINKGLYQLSNGTSQATPHVAGALGLMFSARPSLTAAEATSLVKSTARPIGGSVPNETFGYGYLDVEAAVRAAQQSGLPPATATATATAIPTAPPTVIPTATATAVPAEPTETPDPGEPTATPLPTTAPSPTGSFSVYVPGVTRGARGL
jgi:subtilisin family serine protease